MRGVPMRAIMHKTGPPADALRVLSFCARNHVRNQTDSDAGRTFATHSHTRTSQFETRSLISYTEYTPSVVLV